MNSQIQIVEMMVGRNIGEMYLRSAREPGDVVLDPFVGSGTTAVAAEPPQGGADQTRPAAQLALADPSASYFGRATRHVYWSRIEGGLGGFGRNKGVLGFLGGALFCFPFNYRVLSLASYAGAASLPGGQAAIAAYALNRNM